MGERRHAEYHMRREAEELRRAWRASSQTARRLHLELANHHRARGIACLLARTNAIAA